MKKTRNDHLHLLLGCVQQIAATTKSALVAQESDEFNVRWMCFVAIETQ